MVPYRLKIFKFCSSIIGIPYVWSLPSLSRIGFTEPNSKSVSAFISNPPATGAMAAVSFIPLTLMWEYQNIVVSKLDNKPIERALGITLCSYQLSYSSFLICTENYASDTLHFISVLIFCTSFLVHSAFIIYYFDPCIITQVIFATGLTSGIVLISLITTNNTNTLWFWAIESLGLSCMFLFTPIEWVFVLNPTLKASHRHLQISNPI